MGRYLFCCPEGSRGCPDKDGRELVYVRHPQKT